MQRQNLGTPFLERIMRKGKKQNALLGSPQSGGMNLPSPTGLGSGQKPPPRKTPAAVAAATPAGGTPTPAVAPGRAPAPANTTSQPQLLASMDEEFPIGMAGTNAMTNSERFYRVKGRLPLIEESYALHLRSRFEKEMGRPPSQAELDASINRTYERREEEVLF